MFVRIKTTPNSPRRSVQLVEAVRDGGKVRQRIVRHIGRPRNRREPLHTMISSWYLPIATSHLTLEVE
jgi:hypothetical protein